MRLRLSVNGKVNKDLTIKQLKKVLFRSVLKMHELATLYVPVDKGFLKSSINFFPQHPGATSYILFAAKKYAAAVEFGTSPHIIKPSNKQALKFKSDGQIVFSKKVMHPGTEATPFMRPSLDQVKQIWLPRFFKQELGKKKF